MRLMFVAHSCFLIYLFGCDSTQIVDDDRRIANRNQMSELLKVSDIVARSVGGPPTVSQLKADFNFRGIAPRDFWQKDVAISRDGNCVIFTSSMPNGEVMTAERCYQDSGLPNNAPGKAR